MFPVWIHSLQTTVAYFKKSNFFLDKCKSYQAQKNEKELLSNRQAQPQ